MKFSLIRASLAAALVTSLLGACASDSSSGDEDDAGSDIGGFDTSRDVTRDVSQPDVGVDTGADVADATDAGDTTPDVSELCGDGILDPGEACDDGPDNSDTAANACRLDCAEATCGDGVVDAGEECDDGNTDDSDECSLACRRNATDLCNACDSNDACGGEGDSCVVLDDGDFCGLDCRTNRDCPDGFLCGNVTDVAGGELRQCVPSGGACTDCFDPDRDGYGSGSGCPNAGGDCDQSNGDVYSGAEELCDGIDNDCDGTIDEGLDGGMYYPDTDRDGFGDGERGVSGCVKPEGYVDNGDDCDDSARLVYPDAPELCDEIDNDCDEELDEDTAETDFYTDADGDGFGDEDATAQSSCEPIDGAVNNANDCNDGNALVSPAAAEVCGDGLDNDCDGDLDCDDADCAGAAGCGVTACVDDGSEDNDTRETATTIAAGEFTDLVSCEGDNDFFALSLAAGDVVTIDVAFAHAQGDIDITLVDPDGRIVDFSASEDDDEQIVATIASSGRYAVRVYLYADAGDPGVAYDLNVAVDAAVTECRDDGFEDNDDVASAVLRDGGLIEDLTVCPGDADYFAVDLGAGDSLDVSATFTDADGDIDIRVLRGGAVVAESDSADDNESASVTASTAGRYIVEVALYADGGAPGNTYDLDLDVTTNPDPCDVDGFEDNDTALTPAAIAAGDYPDLMVCGDDADFYSIALGVGDSIDIEVAFAILDGDIDLQLIGPAGTVVAESTNLFSDESISFEAVNAGTYLIRVYQAFDPFGESTDYDLSIAIERAPVACEDDFLEENDTRTSPRFIAPGAIDDLMACPGDDDFYYFDLTAGDTIAATLSFSHAAGDIDLRLLNPDGAQVASSTSLLDGESISRVVETSGRFTLRVNLWSETDGTPGNAYDLNVSVTEGAGDECPTDRLERNDSRDGAEPLPPELYTGLFVCDGNEDWYRTELAAGETLTVRLTFSDEDADVDAAILSPSGAVLSTATSGTDNELVSATATVAGTYYTRVYVYGEGTAEYDIEIDVTAPVTDCTDDFFENNDTPATAFEAGTIEDIEFLTSCPGDDDYFSFDLAVGDELLVLLDFVDAEGDIDMALTDPSGETVAIARGVEDGELIEYVAVEPGVHSLRVYLALDAGSTPGNDYSLSSEIAVAEVSCPTDDRFEDNGTPATGTTIGTGAVRGVILCGDDESDYYVFYGFAGELVAVDLTFLHDDGDLDLYIYDADEDEVAASDGVEDDEAVLFEVSESGVYYIEVFLADDLGSSEGVPYELFVDAI